MSINESWIMYLSVISTCVIAAGVITLLSRAGHLNLIIFATAMLSLTLALLFYFRKGPIWARHYLLFMVLASILIAVIGVTN